MELLIISLLGVGLFYLGKKEYDRHQDNIDSIPFRINVNGIRGKSTVTRLITAILKEAQYDVIGKTTGTSARMIYWDTSEEKPIKRPPEGPNIGEQRMVVKEAKEYGAEALVCECMAVNPDYQITFQNQLLQANIGVIVNVLEDHMDVMGPTLDEVADAFLATIPYNGFLVTIESEYLPLFKQVAEKRGTEVIIAPVHEVEDSYLRKFDYMIFPDNVALGLAVAKIFNIPKKVALRGMLKAQPDPGAMRIHTYESARGTKAHFVNGFAANEPTSSLKIWERLAELGYPSRDPLIIMNCRPDRVDRTEQFARDFLPHLKIGTLLVVGNVTSPVIKAAKAGNIKAKKVIDLEGEELSTIIRTIDEHVDNQMIFGVGNIHGVGEPLISHLSGEELSL